MSRTPLLEKLRRLAQSEERSSPLPDRLPAFPVYEDPVERFAGELKAAGGVFLDGRGEERLAKSLAAVLKASGSADIYWESEEVFLNHSIPHRLRDPVAFRDRHVLFSVHFRGEVSFPLVLHSKHYQRKDLAAINLSISSAAWGVAETGTVALQIGPAKGRLQSFLPPAHAALLSEKKLLMNMAELFEVCTPGDLGSLITLATGPSRTADIEKTLVIGVHGPGQWFVILTE